MFYGKHELPAVPFNVQLHRNDDDSLSLEAIQAAQLCKTSVYTVIYCNA